MTQTLNVEYQELIARAAEIEAPLPPLPVGNPQAPCNLTFVRDAAVQIAINADRLRLYIRACEREWKTLAKSLRNAAKAYEEVDEGAADDIDAVSMDGGTSGSGAKTLSADGDGATSVLCDPDEDYRFAPPPPPPPPPPFQYPYYEVRQAAADIEAPDQGTAFRAFATEWNRYQLAFQQEDYRFRPFLRWEGEARAAVEGNFTSQKQWISGMVGLCVTLAKQAQMVADAHKKVKPLGGYGNDDGTHPSVYEVAQCDATYKRYSEDRYLQQYLPSVVEWYELLQKRSETAISTYIGSAGVPLAALNPNAPYTAYVINPPPTPDPTPDKGDGDGEGTTPVDPVVPGPVPETPGDPAANVPTTPTTPTMPTTPMMPATGMGATPSTPSMPATPDAQAMVNAAMNKAGLPKGGPGAGVKPASVGGGGGAGMPTMPLQPATGGDAAPRPAGAGPGVATEGLGKGLPGAGGTGGGMGGMPLGGQGAKGEGKGKRVASEDDALYTEERAWTEGVIGNRPRKGATEK